FITPSLITGLTIILQESLSLLFPVVGLQTQLDLLNNFPQKNHSYYLHKHKSFYNKDVHEFLFHDAGKQMMFLPGVFPFRMRDNDDHSRKIAHPVEKQLR